MFYHTLDITQSDRARLHQHHEALTNAFNNGKTLQWEHINGMTNDMQQILQSQPGMQSFWQQVQQQPDKSWCLHLTHDNKEILNLPWQIAFDSSLFPNLYISKGLSKNDFAIKHSPAPQPLKMLIMISSPDDLDVAHRLSYEDEERALLTSLAPLWETGHLQIDFTEYGSLENLQQKLHAEQYHILYFTGHGVYENNTGYLLLEDQNTLNSEYVAADDFAATVIGKPGHIPALVILASCQSGHSNHKDGLTGIADELMRAGIPAVIAMAFSISDVYATLFASQLFSQLTDQNSLTIAYGEALKAMRQHEQEYLQATQQAAFPAQWLIPQLYCTQQVEHIIDWRAPAITRYASHNLSEESAFGFQPAHANYQFIGRRRENARIFNRLLRKEAVLLRGQGGVGKTSLASHLVKRMSSHRARFHCFAFDENNMGLPAMMDCLLNYLQNDKGLIDIQTQTDKYIKATDRLGFLLQQVKAFCDPVWVFDNMESCQQQPGGNMKAEYAEWLSFVQQYILDQYPVIFTCRYPIVELPDIPDISLNQVSFVDYYKKSMQLEIGSITCHHHNYPLLQVCDLLYTQLGGNYRALEIFNEIYKHNEDQALLLMQQLHSLAATVRQELEEHSKSLVFTDLLTTLNQQELYTLAVLTQFNRPVVREGVQLQTPELAVSSALQKLQAITLIEGHETGDHCYYCVTPLVRDWLQHVQLPVITFSHLKAGQHYEHGNKRIADNYYEDLHQAFDHYLQAGEASHIGSAGNKLAGFYYNRFLLHNALQVALQVEKAAGPATSENCYFIIGKVYRVFGRYKEALRYFEKCYTDEVRAGCRQQNQAALDRKSVICNNLGLVYYDMGDFDKALGQWSQSADIHKRSRDHQKASEVLLYVCDVHLQRGEINKVRQTHSEAVTRRTFTTTTGMDEKLLDIYFKVSRVTGSWEKAFEFLDENMALHKSTGNQLGAGRIMNYYASAYIDVGEYEKANDYLQEAFKTAQHFGDTALERDVLMNQGLLYDNRENWQQALTYFELGLERCRKVGDRAGECRALLYLCKVYAVKKQYGKAKELFKSANAISGSLKDRRSKALIMQYKACIYREMRRFWPALFLIRKSIKILEQIGSRLEIAELYLERAEIAQDRLDTGPMYRYAKRAYDIFSEFNNAAGLYRSAWLMAEFYCERRYNRDTLAMAADYLETCARIGRKAGFNGLTRIEFLIKDIRTGQSHRA